MVGIIATYQIALLIALPSYLTFRRRDIWITRHLQLIALKYNNKLTRFQVSVLDIVAAVLYLGLNGALMIPQVTRLTIRQASVQLAFMNSLPLLLYGRTNPIINALQIPNATFHLVLRYSAALCLAQIIIHGVKAPRDAAPFTSGITASASILANIAAYLVLQIISIFRGRACLNIVRFCYWILPPSITVATAWHLIVLSHPLASLPWTINILGGLLWLISGVIHVLRYLHHGPAMAVANLNEPVINIQLKRPVTAKPGYFYITTSKFAATSQSRPTPMLWWEPAATSIHHFATMVDRERQSLPQGRFRVQLDGPYYEELYLGKYETVIFVAQGSALSRILPHLLHLTARMAQDRTAKEKRNHWYLDGLFNDKTRKIDLHWKMKSNDEISSVNSYFEELSSSGADKSLQAWVHYPQGIPEITKLPKPKDRQRWFAIEGDFLRQVSAAIEIQSKRTPGRALVVGKSPNQCVRMGRSLTLQLAGLMTSGRRSGEILGDTFALIT